MACAGFGAGPGGRASSHDVAHPSSEITAGLLPRRVAVVLRASSHSALAALFAFRFAIPCERQQAGGCHLLLVRDDRGDPGSRDRSEAVLDRCRPVATSALPEGGSAAVPHTAVDTGRAQADRC